MNKVYINNYYQHKTKKHFVKVVEVDNYYHNSIRLSFISKNEDVSLEFFKENYEEIKDLSIIK